MKLQPSQEAALRRQRDRVRAWEAQTLDDVFAATTLDALQSALNRYESCRMTGHAIAAIGTRFGVEYAGPVADDEVPA